MPCSQSMTTQERWGDAEAATRALRAPGSVSHAPKAGLEVRKARRSGWAWVRAGAAIESALWIWGKGLEGGHYGAR